ncbi:unnamed protein product [Effrenium voratum]|nr:unnamed protein product [Effrenium voratum]
MAADPKSFATAQSRAIGRVGRLPVQGRYVTRRRLEDDIEVTGKILGTGCSGEVLAAHFRDGPGRVAVKAYDLRLLDEAQRERLYAEVEVFLSLDHPHIARLLAVYESRTKLSLVMECMEGGELFDRVAHARQSEHQAAQATWHMLQAVSYLHRSGVVHRDLKLENFLYDASGSDFLKLIDFGFSKFFHQKKHMKEALGTMNYVAPEVLRQRYCLGSCDMWSLGVIVFVLLSGEMPFQGSDVGTARAIKTGRFWMKPGKWFHVSKDGKDFVTRLLVVDPAKRMQAEDALRHPWVHSMKASVPGVRSTTVVTGFRNIARASRFQRACLQAMAWSLTLAERRRLRGAFIRLSTDGVIAREELQEYLSKLSVGKEDFDAIMEFLPEEIHYSDFLAAMMACESEQHEDVARSAFRHFDLEGVGHLTPARLQEVLGNEFDVAAVFDEADLDRDGAISFHDFLAYLHQITELPSVECLDDLSEEPSTRPLQSEGSPAPPAPTPAVAPPGSPASAFAALTCGNLTSPQVRPLLLGGRPPAGALKAEDGPSTASAQEDQRGGLATFDQDLMHTAMGISKTLNSIQDCWTQWLGEPSPSAESLSSPPGAGELVAPGEPRGSEELKELYRLRAEQRMLLLELQRRKAKTDAVGRGSSALRRPWSPCDGRKTRPFSPEAKPSPALTGMSACGSQSVGSLLGIFRRRQKVECMRAALARWKATVQKAGLERLGELDSACAAQLLGTSFDAWRRWQQLRSCRATRPQASTSRARTRMVSRICGREGLKMISRAWLHLARRSSRLLAVAKRQLRLLQAGRAFQAWYLARVSPRAGCGVAGAQVSVHMASAATFQAWARFVRCPDGLGLKGLVQHRTAVRQRIVGLLAGRSLLKLGV